MNPTAPATAPAALVPVHLGSVGTFTGAPMYLARQRGYFTAEGLDVDTIGFKVSADVIPALATGDVDAAGLALNPALFNAVTRGIKLTLVADLASNQRGRATSALVIRKEVIGYGRYTRPEDLRGMTIGVPGPFTNVHYYLALIAERHGFPLEEINVTPVAMADSLLALRNGSLDGYFDIEPSPTIAAREGFGVRVIEADEIYEGFPVLGPGLRPGHDRPTRRGDALHGRLRAGPARLPGRFLRGQGPRPRRRGHPRGHRAAAGDRRPGDQSEWAHDACVHGGRPELVGEDGRADEKPGVRTMVDETYLEQAQQRVGPR